MKQAKFIKSKIAPKPYEFDYWVDLSENPFGSVIKVYNGTFWINVFDKEDNVTEDIENIKSQFNQLQESVSSLLEKVSTLESTVAELSEKINKSATEDEPVI